jgi:outer membrane protein TolC
MLMGTLLIMLVSAVEEPPTEYFSPNEELHTYLSEAAGNHPALKELHEQWLAALERIPQVTSLEDPMFTFGGFVQSSSNRLKFSLSQKFPWFGTLRAQGDKAAAEADAVLARLETERDRIFAAVKEAYFEYQYLSNQIQVTESQQEILSYLEEIVLNRYALAMSSQDDVLRIQIEEEKLRDRYERLLQLRPALAGNLNETLGRSTDTEIEWPQSTTFPPPPPPASDIAALIRAYSPMLREFDHQMESLDQELLLAKKKGKPNFTLGLDYTTMKQPSENRPDRPYPATLNGGRRIYNTLTGQMPFDLVNTGIDL